MKWKDLSLKERKQIYDSVRVNNPGATYFDIKQQFDSIPAYQDGKGKTINKADLPPEYRTGTPEYFERQRKIIQFSQKLILLQLVILKMLLTLLKTCRRKYDFGIYEKSDIK